MKTLLIFLISSLLFSLSGFAKNLPVEAFGSLPQVKQLKLSPNGKNLSYLREHKGDTLLAVTNLETNKTAYIAKSDNVKFKFGWTKWANEKTLLLSIDYPTRLHGINYSESRLMRIAIDGKSKMKSVIKPKKSELIPQFQNRIIDILPDEPNKILMALDLKIANYPSVYKVDLESNRTRKIIHRAKTHIVGWLTDRQHRVRIGFGRDDTRVFFRLLDPDTDTWKNIWEYEKFSAPDISPLGFGRDPNELYIRADHEGRYAIFKVDVSDPKLPKTLMFSDPNYDVEGGLIYSRKSNDVIGVYHGEASDSRVYFDSESSSLQKSLNKALPNSYNNITSFSGDGSKYILFNSSDKSPGAYFLGDKVNDQLDFILDEYPLLVDKVMQGKKKVSYTARDGKKIEAYITLPHENVKNTQAALVIPHGGPMSRNYNGFDWFSEFFASQGYTVIEPNFRGSSGYGFKFEMESIQKWGGVMQDDLADAANWVSKNHKIGKNKICMVGASYGGYAAMMAAAKQQDIFKCAISIAGVSDLEYMLMKARRFTNYKVVKKQIGSDDELLEKQSPITYAKIIKTPLLLIHGEDDRVVGVAHSRKMYEELKEHNAPVQYIELPNGNHSLEIEANRIKTLRESVKFLDHHLSIN